DVVGGTRGLHAIRLKSVGGKLTRSVLGVNYRFFCNPMWSCFRGWERSPPGTHYFNGGDAHEVFWHMIDQVVLRPQALHMFSERTGDKIRFAVESEAQSGGGLTHHCYLIVPAVGYRYPLLRVVQEKLDYPVTIVADPYPDGSRAVDEKELRKTLGLVFRSEPV